MKSLWSDSTAEQYSSPLEQRVYTSRLLGCEPALVLHGGGNTSVKDTVDNFFGEAEELLYVKGSGWDLATIEAPGFAPVKMDTLMKMAALDDLSDFDMVKYQRAAMTDPSAPNPSVEAILHALIPFKFVDHTHTDAVVTITNTPDGEANIREVFGKKVFIIPYVMPGFALAKLVYQMTKDIDWSELEGMVLLNHGLFTFADNAKESYEKTIELVSKAEGFIVTRNASITVEPQADQVLNSTELMGLANIRRKVSKVKTMPTIANFNSSDIAQVFAKQANLRSIATRGPLTPDHVIRTKRIPAIINEGADIKVEAEIGVVDFVSQYHDYFATHKTDETCLNPAPNFAIWQNKGSISFGKNIKETLVTQDITEHTFASILTAEKLGSYQALPEKDIFDVEYWSLEQAKLKKTSNVAPLAGQIVLVTDACSEIGASTIGGLLKQGASIIAVDNKDDVTSLYNKPDCKGIKADDATMNAAVELAVRSFGGLDIVINGSGSESVVDYAAPYQAIGFNASVISVSVDAAVVNNIGTTNIRANQLNTRTNAKPEEVSAMIITMVGATFHNVNNATIVIGE
ncbi:MAG: rhamnose utilization protein RhaD (predicted bifunctional aldolase and dehydrogenase) [Phenylobacterium sp.]|jgi:rhamnose utilization protein RhaD (predicted bifunctional aldolase and dehydrogenase)